MIKPILYIETTRNKKQAYCKDKFKIIHGRYHPYFYSQYLTVDGKEVLKALKNVKFIRKIDTLSKNFSTHYKLAAHYLKTLKNLTTIKRVQTVSPLYGVF